MEGTSTPTRPTGTGRSVETNGRTNGAMADTIVALIRLWLKAERSPRERDALLMRLAAELA